MARAKVMVADSTISAPQMMDFWRKVGDGSIDGPIFQSFLRNHRRFTKEVGVTLARAMNILGEKKVVGMGVAATARGLKEFDPSIPIRFSEAALRDCAGENRTAHTDWRLISTLGFSLRELRDQIGTNFASQPCCCPNDWWLEQSEDNWATAKPEAAYWLIDFNGRFPRTSWNNQELEITKLCSDFIHTPEAVVTEAITTIFQVTDCGDDGYLRVCIARKFQF